MNVPVALEDWSYNAVVELARVGRCEGERHDFKFNLPDANTLTKVACAFANSQGGFVVVGVKDRSGHFLVEGATRTVRSPRSFQTKSTPRHPSPFQVHATSMFRRHPRYSTSFIFLSSPERPHMPRERDKGMFWKRTPGGCEPMSYDEIREQFLRYEERREKVKSLLIVLPPF